MIRKIDNVSQPKVWLSEFLLYRALFKGPNGKPLYTYQVSEEEYQSLLKMLREQLKNDFNSRDIIRLGACFCLFVSEQYRREYNGSWSWSGAETALGSSLTPQQVATLTSHGLEYWKRPIRLRENGRDWLGSLFSEGGLPWTLINSEAHSFGRAIRHGIKYYYQTKGNRKSTTDLIADFEGYLPAAFRSLETRHLLAGIVDQLMYLAEFYPIKDQQEPDHYLDQHAPGWTHTFPIPLDKSNARRLINDWLRDAGQKRQERKTALERARAFTCEHFLHGEITQWTICTNLILPSEEIFEVDPKMLGRTRFELAYYEGDQLLVRGKAIYGQITDDGIKVRFPNTLVPLVRRALDEPLSLRLLDNGNTIYCAFFEDSALAYQQAPLVFEKDSEHWKLVSTFSCSIATEVAMIRIPSGFTISSGRQTEPEILAQDEHQGRWLETQTDLLITKGDDQYQIEFNQTQSNLEPILKGSFALYDSSPSVVYLGWPQLVLPEGYPYARETLLELVNGKPLNRNDKENYGIVRYTLRNSSGKTLLQRRFGVLPSEFNLSILPELQHQPARILSSNTHQLSLNVVSENLVAEQFNRGLNLSYTGDSPPSTFTLEVGSNLPPLQLRLPYPYQGARLIDPHGKPSRARELTLDDLVGHRIAMSSGRSQTQIFHMELELICREQPYPKLGFDIRVGSTPAMVNLFSYLSDMQNMLGSVDEQDAYIKLSVETERPLLRLDIHRYNGQLQWAEHGVFFIRNGSNAIIHDEVKAEAMLLADPKSTPLQISEKVDGPMGAGYFEIPQTMQSPGPWLIYPGAQSKVHFRPSIYVANKTSDHESKSEVCSLHRAAELFHPQHNPDVIEQQIEAMESDFNHSGWQYLADLKQNYAHLSLSSFETWKALSRNQTALSFAVFRLEMDESFCARMRDELAVIWETIPLSLWVHAYQIFYDGMRLTGLPETLIENLVSNRASVLYYTVFGSDFLSDYLRTGDRSSLKNLPPENVLPIWYQALRRFHEANRNWPTLLGKELRDWVSHQQLPEQVKALSLVDFTDVVTYLPIFMAFVTAGKAKITDLPATPSYLKFVIRLVSDFDRQGWFIPAHALMISYLLTSQNEA